MDKIRKKTYLILLHEYLIKSLIYKERKSNITASFDLSILYKIPLEIQLSLIFINNITHHVKYSLYIQCLKQTVRTKHYWVKMLNMQNVDTQ